MVQSKAIDPRTRTCVIRDAAILGGTPVVSGTRVPAATIVAYLRDGHTAPDILGDFPSLPPDAIHAVENWADRELGPT